MAEVDPNEAGDELVLDARFGEAADEMRAQRAAPVAEDEPSEVSADNTSERQNPDVDRGDEALLLELAQDLARTQDLNVELDAGDDGQMEVLGADIPNQGFAASAQETEAAEEESVTATAILSQLVEREVARVFTYEIDDTDEDDADLPFDAAIENIAVTLEADAAPEHAASGDLEALLAEDTTVGAVTGAHRQVEETQAAVEDDSDPHATAGSALESKIAALEKMVARQSGHWDSEDAAEPTFVHRPARTLEWQDREDTAVPQVQAVVEPDSVTANPEDTPATIDEATLRLMVSEIVRQELQGALGERITRNVRKLVRREIHRAILSQEFD
ncbi:hypothetical protein ACN2XU_14340 [Primorskyibacter sp. 2E107]|uniref:hypothetical protein n=1 Tax=Primorskyibacter sp. 2E107 TaxID=3403458 RepID=UPI003AF59B5E